MAGHSSEEPNQERPVYDPRREARRQLARVPLPDDAQAYDLDRDVRKELMSLSKDTADTVARHLVMAGRLVDDDPETALSHARAARALAGRVAAAREANGLVAYAAGEWAEALTELRTARRISGDPSHLPVMADCERALGRPDRALLVAADPQSTDLDAAARVELLIVTSGARRDLGQAAAAVASLQVGALEGPPRPWTARLRYALADALLDGGREDEAREWFARAADADPDGETDAVDRLLALDGVVWEGLAEDDSQEVGSQVGGRVGPSEVAADDTAEQSPSRVPSKAQVDIETVKDSSTANGLSSAREQAADSLQRALNEAAQRAANATSQRSRVPEDAGEPRLPSRSVDGSTDDEPPAAGSAAPDHERPVPVADPAPVVPPVFSDDDLRLFD